VQHLARTLHSTLISTFLDYAPTVFSASENPPETEVHLIMAVGEIVRTLYGALLQASLPVRLCMIPFYHCSPYPYIGRLDLIIRLLMTSKLLLDT